MTEPTANACALVTPPGRGAVATVLVAGLNAAALVEPHVQLVRQILLRDQPVGRILFGRWGSLHGEEVVVCRRSQSAVEIHCHGGVAAPSAILSALRGSGCIEHAWRDCSLLAGDALQREAVWALSQARTERTAAILLDQHQGALRRSIEEIVRCLENCAVASGRQRLARLVQLAPIGLHLVAPFSVVLTGQPNVGKSSLINALLGYDRSIVCDAPGATRDVVTAATALDGWPVELTDTAGMRSAENPLESAGIARAHDRLAAASAVVLVVDASVPWDGASAALATKWPSALVVHNKWDLPAADDGAPRPAGIVASAKTGRGISELVDAIVRRLAPDPPEGGEATPFSPTQADALQRGLAELDAERPLAAAAVMRTLLASR